MVFLRPALLSPPPSTLTATDMRSKVSMFEHAQNVEIKNSSVTVELGATKHDKLDLYLQTASLNAILNAGGRADEVRCYPGTREEVIGKIERWMDGQSEPDRRILWLNGHAGAGKSAIAQTVAENAAEHGVGAANFFFFRGDNTRNRASPLVATLVYQLVKLYPSLRKHLTDALLAQPLAYTAPVREQFTQLFACTIENLHRSSAADRKIIAIIDGLDECEDEAEQLQIMGALHDLVRKPGSPFRVLVASRVEPHIVMFFNKIADSVQPLFLSDEYRAEDDIRKFVIAKFDEIKKTHHLAYTLGEHWPTQTDIDKIVSKSSGQFIYAATVMRFVEYSKDSPVLSLLTVHELRPATSHSPFAQLDALYSHVFSKARDIRTIKWLIEFHSSGATGLGAAMLDILGYNRTELLSLFADISAIAWLSPSDKGGMDVRFYHASLPDYFKNKSRSGIYHVDNQEVLVDACVVCLAKFDDERSLEVVSELFSYVRKATAELAKSLLDTSKRRLGHHFSHSFTLRTVLTRIIVLYFGAHTALCKCILRHWIHFAYIHNFNVEVDKDRVGRTAYFYFQTIRLTQKAKFVVGRTFTHDSM